MSETNTSKRGRNNNKPLRNKRSRKEEDPLENLDRFAGSSDEDDGEPRKDTAAAAPVVVGRRAAKRARKEAVQKKQAAARAAADEVKSQRRTKASPQSGWQLKGGVVARDVRLGTGKPAKPGCEVSITYEGYFPADESTTTVLSSKRVFDSNQNPQSPLVFTLGKKQVVQGMDLGVAGMKVGGRRIITIPHEMGYGEDGSPPEIPPGATLEFEVELVSFEKA